MSRDDLDRAGGLFARLRSVFRPSVRYSVATIFAIGLIGGVVLLGGINGAMEYTNSLEFCISCHEMKDTVYQEYTKTIHYSNRTGVRVVCGDCHVPKAWTDKVLRKIGAVNDIYHTLMGTVDTPEKFEAHRLELAERVWATMTATNSRECRSCHSFEAMDPHKQTARAREKMGEAKDRGQTCIECHKGIAHKRPTVPRDD